MRRAATGRATRGALPDRFDGKEYRCIKRRAHRNELVKYKCCGDSARAESAVTKLMRMCRIKACGSGPDVPIDGGGERDRERERLREGDR